MQDKFSNEYLQRVSVLAILLQINDNMLHLDFIKDSEDIETLSEALHVEAGMILRHDFLACAYNYGCTMEYLCQLQLEDYNFNEYSDIVWDSDARHESYVKLIDELSCNGTDYSPKSMLKKLHELQYQ